MALLLLVASESALSLTTQKITLGSKFKLSCGSTTILRVALSELRKLGWDKTHTEKMYLKTNTTNCDGAIVGDYFKWILTGNKLLECAEKFEVKNNKLVLNYLAVMTAFAKPGAEVSRLQESTYSFSCTSGKEVIKTFGSHMQTKIVDLWKATLPLASGPKTPISLKHTENNAFNTTSVKTQYDLGEKIFVASDIKIVKTADIVVQIKQCYATNPDSSLRVVLIDGGCSQVPSIVDVVTNYAGTSAGFSIKAFYFDDQKPNQGFSLECTLSLCANSNSANNCTKRACAGGLRRRRSISEDVAGEEAGDYKVKVGPFFIAEKKEDQLEQPIMISRPSTPSQQEQPELLPCDMENSGCSHSCYSQLHLDRSPAFDRQQTCACPATDLLMALYTLKCQETIVEDLATDYYSVNRMYYLGMIFSSLILLIYFFYLGFNWTCRRKFKGKLTAQA